MQLLSRLLVPILTAAVILAGCGGSSKPSHSVTAPGASTTSALPTGTGGGLTASAYHARVNAAIAPWDVAVHGLAAHVNPAALREVATTAGRGAREISALKPPPAVADLQPQLAAILAQNALHASQWAQALQANDHAAAARFAGDFRQDGRQILKLDNEYKARGVTL